MVSVQTTPSGHPSIETKFLCVNTELKIGFALDGWQVVYA